MWQFILFRGLQGLGGGAIFPVALAVVADLYTPAERGKYLGLVRGGLRAVVAPRPGHRRDHHRHRRLALDLLRQRAARPDLAVHPAGACCRRSGGRTPGATSTTSARRSSPLAIAPFLIGLTNKQTGEWTDPAVGGLILVGLALGVVFLWIESRAADPIVPLDLFRIRTFSISVAAMFLAAFGFFGAIIFLPRWFQTVAGASATESGYSLLPLLVGLIVSAIASGQIVARTGRYKVLMLGSLLLLALGLFLMTNLTRRHRPAGALVLDAPHRSRHRAVVRGLHADRPERGGRRPDRRRDRAA